MRNQRRQQPTTAINSSSMHAPRHRTLHTPKPIARNAQYTDVFMLQSECGASDSGASLFRPVTCGTCFHGARDAPIGVWQSRDRQRAGAARGCPAPYLVNLLVVLGLLVAQLMELGLLEPTGATI